MGWGCCVSGEWGGGHRNVCGMGVMLRGAFREEEGGGSQGRLSRCLPPPPLSSRRARCLPPPPLPPLAARDAFLPPPSLLSQREMAEHQGRARARTSPALRIRGGDGAGGDGVRCAPSRQAIAFCSSECSRWWRRREVCTCATRRLMGEQASLLGVNHGQPSKQASLLGVNHGQPSMRRSEAGGHGGMRLRRST